MRGEDQYNIATSKTNRETPPRAWGRRYYGGKEVPVHRNTPTCVGKTPCHTSEPSAPQKHPHVRGEDKKSPFTEPSKVETPPRAWGRPRQAALHPAPWETPPRAWGRLATRAMSSLPSGNTPTCVGKTHDSSAFLISTQKHPHVRGEDDHASRYFLHNRETPPRAWGRRRSLTLYP